MSCQTGLGDTSPLIRKGRVILRRPSGGVANVPFSWFHRAAFARKHRSEVRLGVSVGLVGVGRVVDRQGRWVLRGI